MAGPKQLRAGVFLPPHHANDDDVALAMRRDLKLMEWLDELGFDEAWIGEHHSGGMQISGAPELFIAAAAERTHRIRLGTGVVSLPYHHPLMVADRIVQLDHQTRGRAMFGFGPGFLVSDARMMGLDPNTTRERMVEALEVIVRLLAGETVSHDGAWFTLREASLHLTPYTRPRPYIAVTSARTPNGAKTAGRLGLGLLCVSAGSPDGYDVLDTNWAIAQETAAAHGRRMEQDDLRLIASFHLAETREEAHAAEQHGFGHWMRYLETLNPKTTDTTASVEEITAKRGGIVGTPDDAVAYLEKLWNKTGGFGSILMVGTNWMNFENTKRSYELFARHVLPKFDGRNLTRARSLDRMYEDRFALSEASIGAAKPTIAKHFAEADGKKASAAE
jgi:limonene 1,2-monooxygenase